MVALLSCYLLLNYSVDQTNQTNRFEAGEDQYVWFTKSSV
jgi:hypothetical protein